MNIKQTPLVKPNFSGFRSCEVQNHLSGKTYTMMRRDLFTPDSHTVEKIVEICNQPEIYKYIWDEVLQKKPYPREKAEEFLEWSLKGWEKGTHFVFFIITESNEIAAAIDIKSANLDLAEIGYWTSDTHRGLMSNVTATLCDIAKAAGYKKLYAEVRKDNPGSIGVITRNSFRKDREISTQKPEFHTVYSRIL